jgi:AcrR family transcriptional regulator
MYSRSSGVSPAGEDGAMSAPVRPRTPSVDVHGALLTAADALLRREGLPGVTVRGVAAEAGVAPGGVYSRFGGKDGLVDALLIRGFDGLAAATAPRGERDARERLRLCGRRARQFALENRPYYEAMFLHERAWQRTEQVAEHAMAAFHQLVNSVEYAMAAGFLRASDPFDVAQQIFCVVHGAIVCEFNGLILSGDPEVNYEAMLDLIERSFGTPD